MTIYAIGDLQGCHSQLLRLLEKIHAASANPAFADPKFVFMGDLVNRGPESLATLRLIKSLGDRAIALLGNHDLHLLAAAHGVRKLHRSDTFSDVLHAPDRDTLLEWLRQCPLAHIANDSLMVHAGVVPQWSAQQTLDLAHEVECVLRGPNWIEFLRDMYGNAPARWEDNLRGNDRLRCIVNALTRLRYCSKDGSMELTTKEATDTTLPGYFRWYDVPGRKSEDVTVIFGHWSAQGLIVRPNLIGLDTGCVWGGKLTAMRLADRALFQVECPQVLKPGSV